MSACVVGHSPGDHHGLGNELMTVKIVCLPMTVVIAESSTPHIASCGKELKTMDTVLQGFSPLHFLQEN